MSLFTTIALLAYMGLFVTPAFADSGQSNPLLQQYVDTLGQPYSKALPNGNVGWAHFDRGQLVYGFPGDVTGGTQGYVQGWKTVQSGQGWDTANASDASQAPSGNADWASGIASELQLTGSYPGQEPRYIGYGYNGAAISNENFPPDTMGIPIPAQCVLIEQPWTSVSADPNYQKGSGWPGKNGGDVSAVYPYTWGVIEDAIANCYKQFGYSAATDSFTGNPAFKDGLTPTSIENYFELLTMPEPGITGSVRFWNTSNGEAYYKTIGIPWPLTPLPNYYVTTITPFGGAQASSTETVNGQTAAVYNKNGAQYQYTGTVTFGTEPDGMTVTNAGSVATQLWNLVSANSDNGNAPPAGGYYAPVGVCINEQNNFATIADDDNFQTIPADENAGGPQSDEGTVLTASGNGAYTATFTWSVPQGFSGTSIPIAAGINDGWNDLFNATTDIMPDDITNWYADFGEIDLSNNFSNALTLSGTGGNTAASDVPVVGATQPALLVTPSSATVQVGQSEQYTDQYYPNGLSQGDPQNVTNQSTWSAGAGATIDSAGLATGTAAGTTTVTASYNGLNSTADLIVNQQPPPTVGSYSGTLSFQAVNQANIQTLYGRQVGGTLQRGLNIALWTDTVTATLEATQQPDVSPYVPAGGVVTGVTWSIGKATLSYPAQNPDYIFDNPVEPTAKTSTGLTPSGHQATTSFEENWSEDGIGYGSSGPYGIHDALTNSMAATTPKSYSLSATFTLSGTVSGYVPTREPDGQDGWRTVDIPFGPINFAVNGTASQPLWVCGAGAVPVTGTGGHLAVVACLANPQTHP